MFSSLFLTRFIGHPASGAPCIDCLRLRSPLPVSLHNDIARGRFPSTDRVTGVTCNSFFSFRMIQGLSNSLLFPASLCGTPFARARLTPPMSRAPVSNSWHEPPSFFQRKPLSSLTIGPAPKHPFHSRPLHHPVRSLHVDFPLPLHWSQTRSAFL